jgi:hypothetical protein
MRALKSKLLPGVVLSLVLTLMIAGNGFAAMQGAPTTHCNILQQDNWHGITYMSGGFGVEQRHEMMKRNLARDYNLKLVFDEKKGDYVADVNVNIAGAGHKTLLNTKSCGPWFYTKLPSGRYEVTANYNGRR